VAMKESDPNEAERFHVGTTIAGRYRVERPIGEGAMGAVALARHVSLDEKVAIKFLRPELRRDPVAIARLSREAKALARIKSDHVARVLDVGVTLSVGPYMVMEYLEGTDLGEVVDTEGPLPVERAVEVVLQVCEALTVAHTAGITHRDIKPQNLFLARHGQFETLKVLDFGIAEDEHAERGPSEDPASARRTAAPLYGTPSYMSPERVRNASTADHRSDIWSVGVVLHELVTGRAVFEAPTLTETCARVVSDAPLDLERDDAVLPPSLRSIIARCLERDPARRYQSVEELAAALAPLGTMQERFRGRSTGAFSRKLVEEQLALSKTQRLQLPAPSASPPTPGELSTVLREIGAALRWVARAIPLARVYDRPLWLYGAVGLVSALSVLLVTLLSGNVNWVTPRPVAVQAEPLGPDARVAVRGQDTLPFRDQRSELEASATPPAGAPGDGMASRSAVGTPLAPVPSSVGQVGALPEGAAEDIRGGSASGAARVVRASPPPRANASRRHKRAAVEPKAKEAGEEAEPDNRMRLVTERGSRVRLVEDKLVTNRPGEREPAGVGATPGAGARERAAAGSAPEKKARPLPDWLELMRSDSAGE
jgi:serine/threonine protein kinase